MTWPRRWRQRVFGIALGYEDLLDHDELHRDPVLGAVPGRLEVRRRDCTPLVGKARPSRLELTPEGAHCYRRIGHDAGVIEALFVELILDAHKRAPERLVLDPDATDDPLRGRQRRLHETVLDQIRHNLELVRPGMDFAEFNEKSWRIPKLHAPYRYTLAVHGIGMADESPGAPSRVDWSDLAMSGRLAS